MESENSIGRGQPPLKPRLLCVVYGGGHFRACAPVLDELNDRGWHVDLLALTIAYRDAVAAGFEPWRVRDLLVAGDEEMLSVGRRLASAFSPNPQIDIEETAAYLAFGYADLVAAHGEANAAAIYAERGRQAFAPRTLAARMITRANPDVILTTNAPRAEKATIDEAQARGIPAIVLNDLVASPSNFWLHNPDYADRILVLNDAVRDRLLASGHSPAKVIVTGNPAFASMIALRAKRGLKSGTRPRVVLFASQILAKGELQLVQDTQKALHDLACRRPEWRVHVRLHPSEANQTDWIAAPLVHLTGLRLEEELELCDVLVTHGSTVAIEAALAGIPVVQQLGSQLAAETRFDLLGIAVASTKPDNLERAIQIALGKPPLGGIAMPYDSTTRVADEISRVFDAD